MSFNVARCYESCFFVGQKFFRATRGLYIIMATPLLGTFRCPCYPMDRAIIMICDMQYVIGRANALCDVNTLWAARMRYANTLWATPNPTIITRNWKGQCDDCQVSLCWSDGAWIPHFVNTCGRLPLTCNATTSSLWTLWHPVVSITFWHCRQYALRGLPILQAINSTEDRPRRPALQLLESSVFSEDVIMESLLTPEWLSIDFTEGHKSALQAILPHLPKGLKQVDMRKLVQA